MEVRVGMGYDVHRLIPDHPLFLGGIRIPHSHGLKGHSDADVLVHALMDAMLGALALGDIGRHFPPSDPSLKGISSLVLLERVQTLVSSKGFRVGNADCTLVAQYPKIAPFAEEMKQTLAGILGIPTDRLSIKGTTTEGLGLTGREEGIAAQAIVLLTEA